MICIEKNMVITFRYIMRDSKGNVLEDTTSGMPTRYLHGSPEISSILQEQMEGLLRNDNKEICLLRSSAQTPNDYYFQVQIEGIRRAVEKEIVLGYPLEGIECDDDCECYNN